MAKEEKVKEVKEKKLTVRGKLIDVMSCGKVKNLEELQREVCKAFPNVDEKVVKKNIGLTLYNIKKGNVKNVVMSKTEFKVTVKKDE